MKAHNTFKQLSEFWSNAYSTLNTEAVDVESTLRSWIQKVLTADGAVRNFV